MELFSFFPQILILVVIAFVVAYLAWKFPQRKKEKERMQKEAVQLSKKPSSRVSDIKPQGASSDVAKKMSVEKQEAGRPKRKTRRIKNAVENTVSVSVSKKAPVKKAAKKTASTAKVVKPVTEREASLEEKKQMHQNVLMVIDRVADIAKKGGAAITSGSSKVSAFVRKQYASFQRRKMTPQEVNQEKLLDFLENAALALGASDFGRAERLYIEAIKVDPRNVRAYKGLAEIYEKQENFDHALASLEQVLKFNPLEEGIDDKMVELRSRRVQKKMASKEAKGKTTQAKKSKKK